MGRRDKQKLPERNTDDQKVYERMFHITIFQEIQINIMRYILIPQRLTHIRKNKNSAGADAKKRPSFTAGS